METRLLVVEDDVFLRDGLCEMLRREGYAVDCAATCREARHLAAEKSHNLIVLDIMLPDGSGLDLCSDWRGGGLETPILFLTAKDEEVQIVRSLDAGGDDYVTDQALPPGGAALAPPRPADHPLLPQAGGNPENRLGSLIFSPITSRRSR